MRLSYSIPGKIWWITNFLDYTMYKGIHDAIIKERKKINLHTSEGVWPEYLINNKLLKMPNYVKIDTDGGEIEILKGLKKVLKSSKLKSICIENEYGRYEKQKKNKILNIMKQNRFKLKKIDNLNAGYNMFFYR
mgnify:CR=1 FL=1